MKSYPIRRSKKIARRKSWVTTGLLTNWVVLSMGCSMLPSLQYADEQLKEIDRRVESQKNDSKKSSGQDLYDYHSDDPSEKNNQTSGEKVSEAATLKEEAIESQDEVPPEIEEPPQAEQPASQTEKKKIKAPSGSSSLNPEAEEALEKWLGDAEGQMKNLETALHERDFTEKKIGADYSSLIRILITDDVGRVGYQYGRSDTEVIPTEVFQAEPRYLSLKERLAVFEGGFAGLAGGIAPQALTNRMDNANPKAVELLKNALHSCYQAWYFPDSTIDSVRERYHEYQKQLKQAMTVDKNVIHYASDDFDENFPVELLWCEYKASRKLQEYEDSPPDGRVFSKKFRSCAIQGYSLRALKIGGNRFGGFEERGYTDFDPRPCKKMPRKSNIPPGLRRAFYRNYTPDDLPKGAVIVFKGFSYEQEGLAIYKVASFHIWDKNYVGELGGCGEADENIVCQVSGSPSVKYYDHLQFYLKRAELFQKKKQSGRCVQLLRKASAVTDEWDQFYQEKKAENPWNGKYKYKTAEGKVYRGKIFLNKLKQVAALAKKRSQSDWCGSN